MKERQILFSGAMVRSLRADRKTQTRRVLTQAVGSSLSVGCNERGIAELSRLYGDGPGHEVHERTERVPCPYGATGDRLWVREAWRTTGDGGRADDMPPRDLQPHQVWYEADGTAPLDECVGKRRPGMFMPRWASRITLGVAGVRVEHLQDITEADAIAEGVEPYAIYGGKVASWKATDKSLAAHGTAREAYRELWDSLNAARRYGWDKNPYVWVVEFKRANE